MADPGAGTPAADGQGSWESALLPLDLSSIKLPAVLSKADDDRFYDRMNLLEALDDLITALYHQFLELRLAKGWAAELEEIRGWVGRPIDV